MASKHENLGALTFGLDIGIASVGWAVLGENRIIDLGVRCFDKAETAKEGESLNLARRTARLLRRRLRRRAWRLTKLARLLKREGLIADTNVFQKPFNLKDANEKGLSFWQLRVDALDRKLSAEEWARVIYHLCKHRGFHWISRAEEKAAEGDSKSEGGKVKQGLAGTKKLMQEKNYRTAAEMVLTEFPEAQRNKQGDYSKALSRILLGDEMTQLFKHQRELGNPHATEKLEAAILGNGDHKSGLFWAQNPALAGNDLLKMLGHCTFEKAEYRVPKASFTAERHVWLTRLNNLRIVVDGTTRPLNEAERHLALLMPYQQAGDLTYKQLRTALTKAGYLPESFRYTGLAYASGQKADEKAKDPESAPLVKLPAWHELRKTLEKKELASEWQKISSDALDGKPQLLDQIAWVLSVYKDDTEVEAELCKLNLPNAEKMIDALLDIRFDKFSNLSLKALRQIVPLMEQGQRYDEAVANIPEYGHHSQLHEVGAGEHKYLPPFYKERDKTGRMVFNDDMDIPRNPVVLRALNQARKVVNALIKEYGSPHEVHIEMARDLSRPLDERRDVEKLQKEFRDRNEKDKALFAQDFNIVGAVKGKEFEKYQLYREQQGKCAYSIEPMDIHRLFEQGYVEIDHALPYSRSFDDSKNNRVLVLAKENRDKGNRTPFEYLGGKDNSERWRQFVAFVEGNKSYRLAKRSRLLRKDFGKDEAKGFRERNLNDTRYICRFFKNYVEQYLQLHEDSDAKRCVVLSGQMTSFLRARWGLVKVRGDSDRHHALDGAIVAACSHSMVKRLSDYSRRKELEQVRAGFVDVDTGEIVNPAMFQQVQEHFPNPWPHFRDEVKLRLNVDDPALLHSEMNRFGTYSPEALKALRPLFISRAPQRRNSGAAHKDTIYAQPERLVAQGGVTQKVPLTSLTLKDLDKLIDPHRNEKLYSAIRIRLEQHGGKGDKAFPASNPLRKPDSEGNPTGPIVRGVTMVIDKLSGIPIRGGIAKNDSMVRVDVFTKAGKFHLVPVYVHHAVAKVLPNRAVVAYKDETEWTLIDDGFDFCFSMYPNDLLRIKLRNASHLGYYASCNRSTGAINLWSHDRNQQVGKDGMIESIGVKTALNVEKLNIDVLGNRYPAPPEKRRDLA
ncbi:MAG: type II CRISPR RNA-guided endonuclease Cas9 [Gallionellales bacterium GWA2_60_142]|nr:MAG: type II CRISPR RNA-guided endonuclease Cas9 [Gallionellales bacterium GWA2_60_142]HCI14109.1 type II CRISPR RNA-guided endonuclease Cas9 [Gallionellaceae bacterium]